MKQEPKVMKLVSSGLISPLRYLCFYKGFSIFPKRRQTRTELSSLTIPGIL